MIVFLVSGIWHGTGMNFVIWGALHGVAVCLASLISKPLKIPAFIKKLITFVYVSLAWVFFRAENLDYAGKFIGQLFCFHGSVAERPHYVLDYLSVKVVLALVLGILLSGFLQRLLTRPHEKIANKLPFRIVELVFIIFVFAVCMIEVVGGSFASSIYLKF